MLLPSWKTKSYEVEHQDHSYRCIFLFVYLLVYDYVYIFPSNFKGNV